MSLSLIRAVGTGWILKRTCHIPTKAATENSKSFCLKLLRMMSSEAKIPISDEPVFENKNYGPQHGYIPVYSLPLAGKLAFINSSKYNQMRVISIVAPISVALAYLNIISGGTSGVICATGIVLAVKLHLLGLLSSNLIGFVYISPDKSTVQIAYIDQNGKRKEEFLPVSEIVPFSEAPSSFMESLYSKVYTYSKQRSISHYKLSVSFGKIVNSEDFHHIFGHYSKLD